MKIDLQKNKEKILVLVTFIVVVITNLFFLVGHEYWRDETQAWLIARDTILKADSLFTVTSYEGHPLLWFILLMPFAKVGAPLWTLKLISYAMMTTATALLLYKTRFPVYIKLLAAFSPMFIYSWVVPARSYALSALLMILLIVLYRARQECPLFYGIVLALLLQTLTIYAAFVFACSVVWLLETIYDIRYSKIQKEKILKNAIGLTIVLISALFLLWEFRYTGERIDSSVGGGIISFVVALLKQLYYGLELLFPSYAFVTMLIFIFIAICLLFSRTTAKISFVCILGIGWQLYIYAFVYNNNGNNRVISWLYIILFAINMAYCDDASDKLVDNEGIFLSSKFLNIGLSILLLMSFQYNSSFITAEIAEQPYSQSTLIADEINKLPNDAAIFISSSDFDSSVVAQVDKNHVVMSPFSRQMATFCDRNPEHSEGMEYEDFIRTACTMFPDKSEIYVIVDSGWDYCYINRLEDLYEDRPDNMVVHFMAEGGSISGEDYLLLKIIL